MMDKNTNCTSKKIIPNVFLPKCPWFKLPCIKEKCIGYEIGKYAYCKALKMRLSNAIEMKPGQQQ